MQAEDIQRIRTQEQQDRDQYRRDKQHEQLMSTINLGLKKLKQPTARNNSLLIKIANQILDLTDSK